MKKNQGNILKFILSFYLNAVFVITITVSTFLGTACKTASTIEDAILYDKDSYFYINIREYPENKESLPIGVFDSGTGGLAVLNDIVEYESLDSNGRLRVFENESFIYLADMANMPYGSYALENNTGLLQEHIIKNVQFLLDSKYYQSENSHEYMTDKSPVKAIVIACNTATAYGQEIINNFIDRANMDIIVIGVIDAATTGAINYFSSGEDGSIAVLATDGTVRSGAYVTSIEQKIEELGYHGEIQVFQQAGIGIAEAIDENKDFFDRSASMPREGYMGPSEKGENELHIDLSLWDRYRFQIENGALLYEGNSDNLHNIQINSVENYVAFHLVSLMEKIISTEGAQPLKSIILGCTHYPYVEELFIEYLDNLRNYQEDGEYIYRNYMAENIILVNPGFKVARQLHELLDKRNVLSGKNSHYDSEFYIAVPNVLNNLVRLREDGSFTYEYKYSRKAGNVQEYVKRIPFSRHAIPGDILERLSIQVPSVYDMIVFFNQNNPKTEYLENDALINNIH